MDEKNKGRKKKRKNREVFEEDKEGWVKRRIEGKRNVSIGKDLRRTKEDGCKEESMEKET